MPRLAVRKKASENVQESVAGNSERRSLMGKFFYNVALACFTVLVLGNVTEVLSAITGNESTNAVAAVLLGLTATALAVYIANRILKGGK